MIYLMSGISPHRSSRSATLSVQAMDGDPVNISVVDRDRIDIGKTPIWSTHAMTSGRPVLTENLPTRIRKRGSAPRRKLPDFQGCNSIGHIVSDRFRKVVETLCGPDVHQFERVTVTNLTKNEEVDWFWFIPCVRLFAVDPEKADPPLNELGYYFPERGRTSPKHWTAPLLRDVVAPHPIFVCAQFLSGYVLAHDRVFDAMEAAGVTGLYRGSAFPQA